MTARSEGDLNVWRRALDTGRTRLRAMIGEWRGLPDEGRRRALLAAALAIVASSGLWLENLRLRMSSRQATTAVLTASRDLAAGTVLAEADLRMRPMPSSWADGLFVAAEHQPLVVGQRLLTGLSAELPLPWPIIATVDVAPLHVTDGVPPGWRPVMIEAPTGVWPSGWISIGSRVDVVWTAHRAGGTVAKVLHQRLPVLSIEEAAPMAARAAVIAAPVDDVAALLVAASAGRLDLLPRPAADAGTAQTLRAHEDQLWRQPSGAASMPDIRIIRGSER